MKNNAKGKSKQRKGKKKIERRLQSYTNSLKIPQLPFSYRFCFIPLISQFFATYLEEIDQKKQRYDLEREGSLQNSEQT